MLRSPYKRGQVSEQNEGAAAGGGGAAQGEIETSGEGGKGGGEGGEGGDEGHGGPPITHSSSTFSPQGVEWLRCRRSRPGRWRER
jgi:hypothetical protein